jgi:hypothetical protein
MRGTMLLGIALLLFPVTSQAQQVEFVLDWHFEVPQMARWLDASKLKACRQAEIKTYIEHFNANMRFWKFKAPDNSLSVAPPAIFRVTVRSVGTSMPKVIGQVQIQLPGLQQMQPPRWTCEIYPDGELDRRLETDPVPLLLQDLTQRLREIVCQEKFYEIVDRFQETAWVTDHILLTLPTGDVALPLPWDWLKNSAQSVFLFHCDDRLGRFVPLLADGLACSFSQGGKRYLLTHPQQPMKGLKVRFVFVRLFRKSALVNCDLDVLP